MHLSSFLSLPQITISDTDLLIQYGSQSHIFQEIDEERFQVRSDRPPQLVVDVV